MLERKRRTIMLVDDNPVNLTMGKNMLKDYYEVYALPSAERLFKFLETITPDLILLDIQMPGMNGFDVIKILKATARHADIPVIFVTAKSDETDELEGLELGAADYITKPFSAAIMLKRVENHLLIEKQKAELKGLNNNLIEMVKEKTKQVLGLQNSIIDNLAEIVEFRDSMTGGHINRTQRYMKILMEYLIEHDIYPEETIMWDDLDYIVSSTKLHDLGKVFIGDEILNKPGNLTKDEFEKMKTHVIKGVGALNAMDKKGGTNDPFLRYAEIVALAHHEKWDGSGYPSGLKGREIPLLGRLMAIADVYDALTSERPYRKPMKPAEAAKVITDGDGSHFDPVLVEVFKQLESSFASVSANN